MTAPVPMPARFGSRVRLAVLAIVTLIVGVAPAQASTHDGVDDTVDQTAPGAYSVTVDDLGTISEGHTGSKNVTFTVRLTPAAAVSITVNYRTEDKRHTGTGTDVLATAGVDYETRSGQLTFTAGQSTKTVTVPVTGDADLEPDERFELVADVEGKSTDDAATAADQRGLLTIGNDDSGTPASIRISDLSAAEGTGGTTTFSLTVTRDGPTTLPVRFRWKTTDATGVDTASSSGTDADYSTVSAIGDINEGATSTTLQVAVVPDARVEKNEPFLVDLLQASNATISDTQATATIRDDDMAELNFTDTVVGDEPPPLIGNHPAAESNGTRRFTVRLSTASGMTVTVNYETSNGTATAPGDYTAKSGTLTFRPTDTTLDQDIDVPVIDDTTPESTETFTIALTEATNANLGSDTTAIGRIDDNDTAPNIDISKPVVTEGNSGTTPAEFIVSLSHASGTTVTVDYDTGHADDTAAAGSDYVDTTGTVAFAPGETAEKVAVPVKGDSTPEGHETFSLTITGENAGTVCTSCGTATIRDDEAITVTVGDAAISEGDPPTLRSIAFEVTLSTTLTQDAKVTYRTVAGTAQETSDFTPSSGDVTIATGQSTALVEVPVTADTVGEPTEFFTLELTGSDVATVADDNTAVGEISDDDSGAPTLSIDNVTAPESGNLTFTVTLDGTPNPAGTSFRYMVTGVTAQAPADFAATSTRKAFGPGETTATITVQVNNDGDDEVAETLKVTLSEPSNAVIADSEGIGTITDNDGPHVTINDVTVTEGSSGTTDATFTVSLNATSVEPIDVAYTTDNVAPGEAGSDYTAKQGTLTFPAGNKAGQSVTVKVVGDTQDEADETFLLELSLPDPSRATLGRSHGIGTIVDDDGPAIAVADDSAEEGDSGTANEVEFAVSLSAASPQVVTVNYTTVHVTAVTADYVAKSGTVTFPAESTDAQTITVAVKGDAVDEADETFKVVLSGPVNATISDGEGIGTIVDDDGPGLAVQDTAVTEGNTGTTEATFVVTLGAASPQVVTVDYATTDGSAKVGADDDTGDNDYVAKTGTLTFPANSTTPQEVKVVVNGDTTDETNETFTLTLSNAQKATISDATATGTITDDDGPTVSIGDATVTEGLSGTTNANFTVSISAASPQVVTVDYTTVNQTATAPADYTATSGTLVFPANTTASKTVTVAVKGDNLDEVDETFKLVLSNPQGATLADGEGVGTITDDDAPPTLSIGDHAVTEGDHSAVTATLVVTLSNASGKTVTVTAATRNGTAVASSDYTPLTSHTLTFAPGETSKSLNVLVTGDTQVEPDEHFFVDLSGATNATVADEEGRVTIVNNDVATAPKQGYWMTGSDAGIFNFGSAGFFGSKGGEPLNKPIVGMAPTPDGKGYWQVASDGGIFSFGNATFFGSKGGEHLNKPVVGMAATADGKGYWLVASDGGIFTFGNAGFFGSKGGQHLNKPIVGMAATPDGKGYWLVASDGGIFTFGNAVFYGSKGGELLNQPIVGMAATPDGKGYWLVASDGGIFTFGNAGFHGSTAGRRLDAGIVGMARTPTGKGYWLAGANGAIFAHGDAQALGSMAGKPLNGPIVGIAAHPG